MALTLAELAGAIRVGDGTSEPRQPLRGILERLQGAGDAYIERFASTAPDAIKEEAIIRFSAYVFDQPNAGRGLTYSNAWHHSGAASLVSPGLPVGCRCRFENPPLTLQWGGLTLTWGDLILTWGSENDGE